MIPPGINIRLATEADSQGVFALMDAFGYPGLSQSLFAGVYREVLRDPSVSVVLAEAESVIVGLATVSKRPQLRLTGNLVTIDELAIAPEWRGRQIGKALLNHAKEIASQSGCRRLELLTNRSRESYRRGFYIKNGFTEADSAVMRIEYEFEDQ